MSFGEGLMQGVTLARNMNDIYTQAKQRGEYDKIQNATPEYSDQYSDADVQRLRQIASARDAQGNNYYQLDPREGGGYGLSIRGEDGNYSPVQGAEINPSRSAMFLGNRYSEAELTPDRIEGLKARAMAGVLAKDDPIKAMMLRAAIKSEERSDQEHSWKVEDRPVQQRTAALGLNKLEREENQGVRDDQWREAMGTHYKAWDDMGLEGQQQWINKNLNYGLEGRGRGFLSMGQDTVGKDGKTIAGKAHYMPEDGGAPISLSRDDVKHMFAVQNAQQIDPVRAQQEIRALSKEGREAAMKIFQLNTGRISADASMRSAAAHETSAAAIKARYSRPQAGDLREFQNDKGESVLVDVTGLKANADGTLPIPTGLKPKSTKPEYTPKLYSETVKAFTESGMSLPDAQMEADKHFGRGPAAGSSDSRLQALNKDAGKARGPQIVRAGETRMTDPSRPIQSPLADFERVSERGLFGGVNYMYRDPLTGRKYTVDEYNKLSD